jgi:preprotein translocase subunit SecA
VDTLSDDVEKLTDEELRGKTAEFKARVQKGDRSTTCCPRRSPWRARRRGAP